MSHADDYNQKGLDAGTITAEDVTGLTKSYQRVMGLTEDGMLGPKTLAVLRAGKAKALPLGDIVFPMPRLRDGREPVMTSGHHSENPSRPTHQGCDYLYRYDAAKDGPVERVRTDGRWWVPDYVDAVAVHPATVMYVQDRANGWAVTLELSDKTRVVYRHLEFVHVRQGEGVQAGQPIGRVGHTTRTSLVHLHFEVFAPNRYTYTDSLNPRIWLQGAKLV